MNHPLKNIASNCALFISRQKSEFQDLKEQIEEMVLDTVDGIFHSIIDAAEFEQEAHDRLTNNGYIIAQAGTFVPDMAKCILFNMALREKGDEFLLFLYKELDQAVNPSLEKSGRWKIEKQEGKMTLYNLKPFVPRKVSLRKKAKIVYLDFESYM